jgi:beta-ribofuranosylaminobenzene 5'-phosphate synthase
MVVHGDEIARVETNSRLHFGFIDMQGSMNRLYGSLGVALQSPRTVLTARRSDQLTVENGNTAKVTEFVRRFSRYFRIDASAQIRFEQQIPEHIGLGTGTQLGMAVGSALAKLYRVNTSIREIAVAMHRGKRSGIGIAGFAKGGFFIDSGIKTGSSETFDPPSVLFHHPFPNEWCFVIAVPKAAKGLSGAKEYQAIQSVNPSEKIAGEISHLTLMKLLPSLIEKDIEAFGSALMAIDQKNGLYFQNSQGGIFKEAIAASIIRHMVASGAFGAGQSSWGPALYGLVKSNDADNVAQSTRSFFKQQGITGCVEVSTCSNHGASVHLEKKSTGRPQQVPAWGVSGKGVV